MINVTFVVTILLTSYVCSQTTEDQLAGLLAEYDKATAEKSRLATLASWNVATDVGNAQKEEEKVSTMEFV